jgi:hypothetical protein
MNKLIDRPIRQVSDRAVAFGFPPLTIENIAEPRAPRMPKNTTITTSLVMSNCTLLMKLKIHYTGAAAMASGGREASK